MQSERTKAFVQCRANEPATEILYNCDDHINISTTVSKLKGRIQRYKMNWNWKNDTKQNKRLNSTQLTINSQKEIWTDNQEIDETTLAISMRIEKAATVIKSGTSFRNYVQGRMLLKKSKKLAVGV